MQKSSVFLKRTVLPLLVLLVLAAVLFWTVRERWEKESLRTDSVKRSAMAENIGGDTEALQQLTLAADTLEGISLDLYVQDPSREGRMSVTLEDPEGQVLSRAEKAYGELIRDGMNRFPLDTPLGGMKGRKVLLRIHTDGGVWLGYGHSVSAGKAEVDVEIRDPLRVGGMTLDGCLVAQQEGWNRLAAASRFWPVTGIVIGVLTLLSLWSAMLRKKGKRGLLQRMADLAQRYRYLLKQLVLRDFKVKYKASLLGMLWSFLNPLLMTLVYHLVFSNLFSSQENFVVYLMTGTILFNFVSESTSQGLNSIVGNAGLISKVYMPKYIFPLSKVLSAAINLMISMVPLMVLMLLTGLPFTKGLLLIPLLVILLVIFCAGISLILSALMVFFRDIQFIWSVLLLMWNFMSPVFYPESIIPASLINIYRMNPLYQFMTFLRSIVLNGTAPGPACFGYCIAAALISLCVGLLLFRKMQKRFAIYL